jgi:deoxyribodipyrimidine photo-lyase
MMRVFEHAASEQNCDFRAELEMKRVIHWFRRDLRITDNTALYYACREAEEVIPAYILSNWKGSHQWTGPGRQEFLCGCLDSLAKNLAQIGGRLILRSGSPTNELIKLALESHAQAIYFNRNYSPYDVRIEQQIQESAGSVGLEIRTFKDTVIMAPDEILNQRREPFRVFTPYARAWHQRQKPKPLPQVRNLKTPCSVPSEPIPTLEHWCLSPGAKIIEPGERAARNRLRTFLKGPIFKYATRRNQPGAHGTSRLSQDLRFGTISPREVYAAC